MAAVSAVPVGVAVQIPSQALVRDAMQPHRHPSCRYCLLLEYHLAIVRIEL